MRPLHDWLLVEVEPAPEKIGSIIVPDSDSTPIRIGKVKAVGPGGRVKNGAHRPMTVKNGERVAFFMAVVQTGQNQAITHRLGGNRGLIREADVLFICDGDVRVGL